MKRILLLLLLPALLYAAGVTINETNTDTIDKIVFAWTSDSTGAVTGTTTARYTGAVGRVIFDPGAPAPSDNYDVAIYDQNSYDILKSRGYNKDSLVTSQIDSMFSAVANSKLMLVVVNAGDSTSGVVTLYIIPTTSDESVTSVDDTTGLNTLGKLYYYTGDSTLYIGTGTGLSQIATGTGDIASVTAGWGLSGGGNSGAVSLAVDTSEVATQYDLATVQIDNININDGTIANVDIDSNAAIAGSKLADNGITYAKLDTGATGFVDVRKFGAVGDSTTNDYAAIWAAIEKSRAWGKNGGKVYLPAGTYRIGSTIKFVGEKYNNLILEGEGRNKTVLVFSPTTGNAIEIGDGTTENITQYINIRDMTIKGSASTSTIDTTNNGIVASWGANCKFNNLLITKFRGSGFKNLEDSWTNTFHNCDFSYNNQYGVYGNKFPNLWAFYNCNFIGNKVGSFFRYLKGSSFYQSDWTSNDSTGLIIKQGGNLNIIGCWFEANNTGGHGNTTHLSLGDSVSNNYIIGATLLNNSFSTVTTINFAICMTIPFDLTIDGFIAGGTVAPIKLTKYNTYAYQQLSATIKNVLGNGDSRPLMYMRSVPVYAREYKNNTKGILFNKTDSLKWIQWTGDNTYSTSCIYGGDNIVNIASNSTQTSLWATSIGLNLKNTSNTNNNFMAIQNLSSSGGVSSGIGFKTTNQSSSYGSIHFATRDASGFHGDLLSLVDYKVGINDLTPDAKLDVHGGGVLANDSLSVGSGGIWQRNWFYNAADSSLGVVFYNTTLARVDTVFMRQP